MVTADSAPIAIGNRSSLVPSEKIHRLETWKYVNDAGLDEMWGGDFPKN
jgi:hypothetical protein